MTWQRWLVAFMIVLFATTQYVLALYAMRDLARRPSVRGGSKVTWALLILSLPVAGPLIYTSVGPTSFIGRPWPPFRPYPGRSLRRDDGDERDPDPEPEQTPGARDAD